MTRDSESDLVSVAHPEHLGQLRKVVAEAARLGKAGPYTHRLRTANGGWLWARAHVRSQPVGDRRHPVHVWRHTKSHGPSFAAPLPSILGDSHRMKGEAGRPISESSSTR